MLRKSSNEAMIKLFMDCVPFAIANSRHTCIAIAVKTADSLQCIACTYALRTTALLMHRGPEYDGCVAQ